MATPRPFVVDPVLTAIAIGYTNPDIAFIGDQVLPRVGTASSFQYDKYGLEDFDVVNNELGRRGATPRVEFSANKVDSSVKDYGLEASIPQTDIDDAAAQRAAGYSGFDPRARAVKGLKSRNMVSREKRVAAIVHSASTYAAGRQVQLSGTSQLTDYTNSDPIGVIQTAINGLFIYKANTLAMSRYGWRYLRSHPKLVKAVKGGISGDGMISREQFIELFELNRLLIGEPLRLSRLIERISRAAGEDWHHLTTPLADVVPTNVEILVPGTITVTEAT